MAEYCFKLPLLMSRPHCSQENVSICLENYHSKITHSRAPTSKQTDLVGKGNNKPVNDMNFRT